MKKIEAFPHTKFDEICKENGWNDTNVETLADKAFISITCTKDVKEHYLHEDDEHWFKENHTNVLNLDFDDVTHDIDWHDYKAHAITDEQAQEIVNFIENNLGKTILVHCRAGQSRSVAVVRFVLQNYKDIYTWEDCVGAEHNYATPNVEVLRKLNHILWERKFNEKK